MNDHHLPPDELASAFLDGELGAEEADAVQRDPESAARVDELRQAAEAVGAPVTPPESAEDAAVAAALADFDARRAAPADIARQRPRRIAVITGVAAAVAIGFVVAAAVGLFAEREDTAEMATAAAPPAAPAPADYERPAPAPASEPAAAAAPAPEAPPPAAAMPDADLDRVEALAFEALEAVQAAEAAAEPAQATAEGNQAAVAAADDDMPPEPALTDCVDAIGGRAVGLRLTAGGTPIVVLTTPDGTLAALDGTTCAEIPAEDSTEVIADAAPDGCAAAIGGRAVGLRLTAGDTPIVVLTTPDGTLAALDGTTCAEIPAG